MKEDEALQLLKALLARPNRIEDAKQAFAKRYPDAPKEMLETATFHVVVDGIGAALDWLASIETFLKNPDRGLDYGVTWHLLHHLYNWQQFEALLPLGKHELAGQLKDIKMFLEESNPDAAKKGIEDLLKCLDGNLASPSFE